MRPRPAGADLKTAGRVWPNPCTEPRVWIARSWCPGRQRGDLAALGLLLVTCRDQSQDLLLIRPDQNPHVKEHHGADPHAEADDEAVAVLAAVAEREGADELVGVGQIPEARQPGRDGAPPEPGERGV